MSEAVIVSTAPGKNCFFRVPVAMPGAVVEMTERGLIRYAFSTDSLRAMSVGPPGSDLRRGQEQKRYRIDPDQRQSTLGMISRSTLSAMPLVVEGHKTWRASGADAAELVLGALGVAPREARKIANLELPPLSKLS